MKTITVEISVSGRLDEDDVNSFASESETIRLSTIDSMDDAALVFLGESMPSLGKLPLERWKTLRKEYKDA